MLFLHANRQSLESLRFSPAGTSLAADGASGVLWWSLLATSVEPVRFGAGKLLDYFFDPSGRWLVTSTERGGLRLGNTHSGDDSIIREGLQHCRLTASHMLPLFVTWISSGNQLTESSITGWRLSERGEFLPLWEHSVDGSLQDVWFARDGLQVVLLRVTFERLYRPLVCNAENGTLGDASLPFDLDCAQQYPRLSPDGSMSVQCVRNRLLVYETSISPPKSPISIEGREGSTFIDAAFHPTGRYFAATTNDGMVTLYDPTSWESTATYSWNIGRLRSVAFSPDGTLAAVGSNTGKIVVWDVDF